MLDIEFISTPPERFVGLLIYRYRTGVLRRQFSDVLEKLAHRAGGDLLPVDPTELAMHWSAVGLFDGIRLCEFPAKGQGTKLLTSRLLDLVRVPPPVPTALYSSANAFDAPGIKKLPLFYVEEPVVSGTNLASILGFIARTPDLTVRPTLAPTKASVAYFHELLEGEGGTLDLRALIAEYDRASILYQDLETGKFKPPTKSQIADEGRSFVVKALRRFISSGGGFTDAELIRAVATKARRGWSARELTDELCRATRILLESMGSTKRVRNAGNFGSMSMRPLVLWAAMLIAQTAKDYKAEDSELIPSVEELMLTLHQLIRQFGVGRQHLEDEPLRGCWPSIDRVVQAHKNEDSDDEPDARSELIAALRKSVAGVSVGGWLGRLNRMLSKVAPVSGGERISLDRDNPTIPVKSFADLFGQERVLTELRQRFANNTHGKPLVIVGAPGSGKRSVARLYAKALLCEGEKVDGIEPCCHCKSCVDFGDDGDFNYVPFDLGLPNALQYVIQYVEALWQPSFARHRTIVFSRPEKSPASLDAFLKPFEDGVPGTTFIVLATDQGALQTAALSRSRVFRLAPLGRTDARTLVSRILSKADFSDEVIELVVEMGGGVPGRLLQLAGIVKASEAYALSQARVALGIDWGRAALAFWSALFSGIVDAEVIKQLTLPCSPQEAFARTARVLLCLEKNSLDGEPALFRMEDEFAEVGEKLSALPNKRAMTRPGLCAGVMSLWRGYEIVELEDLTKAAQKAQEIICA